MKYPKTSIPDKASNNEERKQRTDWDIKKIKYLNQI